MMCRIENMYAWYFNFYATTVNILNIYTVDLFHMGLRIYNAIMKYNHETFYLSFSNAMLMQKKVNMLKLRINHTMRKSKYG
jgi:hypothetical protein